MNAMKSAEGSVGRFSLTFGLFAFASVMNRGAPLIILPLITLSFSISEIGIFSVAQALIAIAAPIACLNGSAAVLREGTSDSNKARDLFIRFSKFPVMGLALLVCIQIFWDAIALSWLYWVCVLAMLQSTHDLALTKYRASALDLHFLTLSALRLFAMIAAAYLSFISGSGLDSFLYHLTTFYSLISVIVTLHIMISSTDTTLRKPLNEYLKYTILLIPHNISQWVLSSSARILVLHLIGQSAAGIFGLASIAASPASLLLTTLTMMLPRHILANIESWRGDRYRLRGVLLISLGVTLSTTLSILIILLDYITIQIYKYYSIEIIYITGIYCTSFGILSFYVIYGNFLFYSKKTKSLAIFTLIAAFLNIVLIWLGIYIFGLIGAALAPLLSYCIYLCLIIYGAQIYDPDLIINRKEIIIIVMNTILNLFIVYIFHKIWIHIYSG